MRGRRWRTFGALTIGVLVVGLVLIVTFRQPIQADSPIEADSPRQPADTPSDAGTRVVVVRPKEGGLANRITLPCSAHWHDSAELYARVSGYLKVQDVDIGSRVRKGQLLAEIDVPELEVDVELLAAARLQAQAEVRQAEARQKTSEAEYRGAEAARERAEADLQRWEAERAFREKEHQRLLELSRSNSVQAAIVDEKYFQLQSAEAGRRAAESAIDAAQQELIAAQSRVELANADVKVAQAKLSVAEARHSRAQVMAGYAKILSPYDGVVTLRNFHRGDFVRAADQGGGMPLLKVARTDLIRVVVQIPDRNVPHAHPGDPVRIGFDALPGQEFTGELARISHAEDAETRTMRAEVDLPNPEMIVVSQMYGRMEIVLGSESAGMRLPSTCVLGGVHGSTGEAQVFVVRDNTARLQSVTVAGSDGTDVEITAGLDLNDEVVVGAPAGLEDGTPVIALKNSD